MCVRIFQELKVSMPSFLAVFFNMLFLVSDSTWEAFGFAALSAWNKLQSCSKHSNLMSLEAFDSILDAKQRKTVGQCLCFGVFATVSLTSNAFYVDLVVKEILSSVD